MPQDIEPVFTAAGSSLFPARRNDLKTACSCPDSSNPCKHIAAVYYLLGEEFDRDPFLIFTLRGLTREELFERLEQADGKARAADSQPAAEPAGVAEPVASEPLPSDPSLFWNGQPLGEDPFGEVAAPPVAAALPRRLGGFPFWRGVQPFLAAVEPVYATATPRALDLFVSQDPHDARAGN
ncbi:MAG TPA: SWIM zinc finger family protein [Isosphaeraceae bacterium]|nr:SWIM zinc finger family protein [Isosphaeraceae bacterium]